MGASGRICQLACLILVLYLNYEGTIVASPTSAEAAEGKGSPSFFGNCSSPQTQALEGSNSCYSYAPRVYAPEADPNDGESSMMVLSVSSPRREEQRDEIMVQQLRSSLQHGEVVAAGDVDKAVKISQSSQKREREETAEGCGREGVEGGQRDGAIRNWRDECHHHTMDRNDTDPRSLSLDTPASQGWRNGTKRRGGGEGPRRTNLGRNSRP